MPDKPSAEAVAKCQEWRQGDFALGCGGCLFGDIPDMQQGEEDYEPIQAAFDETDPEGFVVVSQTCDIVRDEGMVVICPLERLMNANDVGLLKNGRMPGFGLIELAPEGLFADLTRLMSISKELLATWDRCDGFADPAAAIRFARALERKFGRFAFPHDFNVSISAFVNLTQDKIYRYGPLGKVLRSLWEMRVRAAPDWEADAVTVQFILICREDGDRESTWEEIRGELVKAFAKIQWTGAFKGEEPLFRIGTYDDFSSRDYIESTPLDLNALSFSARYAERKEG